MCAALCYADDGGAASGACGSDDPDAWRGGEGFRGVGPLPATGEVALELLPAGDPRALPVMRHSAAHIMARAVMRLFDGVELAFGPTVGAGFYYDMRASRPITDEDIPRIEEEMRKIIAADEAFERVEVPRAKAVS